MAYGKLISVPFYRQNMDMMLVENIEIMMRDKRKAFAYIQLCRDSRTAT